VKANAYVTRAEGIAGLERAWDDILGKAPAATTTVVVPALAIDGAEVEVDAVAVRA
jgi:enamine deaminase RidA (YjgF/YER057c/UK114 family)